MRILYLDCFSGISGDMTLAALVDAGADREYIETELAKLQTEPYILEWKRVMKRGISALKLNVIPDPDHPPKHHRHYSEIVKMITGADFSERATSISLKVFERIAIAEAKIHGTSIESVHFHEVGAVDSIVDIVGIALAIDSLQIDKIVASPAPLGSGTVRCDHGLYPVPAPATLEMMKGLPVLASPHRAELTTPTGAGVLSGAADEFSPSLPSMVVEAIGYGAGTMDLPNQPNVVRVILGRVDAKQPAHHHHHTHLHHHEHDHHHHEHDHHHHEHDHHHDEHDHHHHEHDHGHKHVNDTHQERI